MTTQCVQVKLEIGHKASIRAKPTSEGFTHDWTVFVRGPEGCNVQHFVERVVFQLHESFPKPKRVVKEPPYQVSESGYAGFILPIEVVFKNKEEPKKVIYNYDLYLQLEGPPINPARVEKLTFQNPTDDFRRKLIRAGGVGVVASEGGTILNPAQHVPSKPSPAHSNTSSSAAALGSGGAYKKQISEAIKAPKSSTSQAVAPTDSVAPQPAISSSSSSSSPSSPVVAASTPAPLPTSSVSTKEVVQRSVATHLHVPTSFVDLFGQPIKTIRSRSPDASKAVKEQRPVKSSSSSSSSSKSSKPFSLPSSTSSVSSSSSSSSSSKDPVTLSASSSIVRTSSSFSKGPKSSKTSTAPTPTTQPPPPPPPPLPPQLSSSASATTKETKSRTVTKEKLSSGKRPPSPPPLSSEPEKKRKSLGSSTATALLPRPPSSSKTKDSRDKKSVTVLKDRDKRSDKVKRGYADNDNDERDDVKIRKEKRPASEDKSTSISSSVKGPLKSFKKINSEKSQSPRPPSSLSNNAFGVSDARINQTTKAPPTTPPPPKSPLPESGDVVDGSPSSSISFSSLPGNGCRGSGPLGALMAELVDEDDFLSPLSSGAGSPAEVEPPSTPPPPPSGAAEKRPPSSPPLLPPPPPPPPPPSLSVVERQKLKEKKRSEKNDLKATKKILSSSSLSSAKKKSSSASLTSSSKVKCSADEAVPVQSSTSAVVSTTDEHAVLITDDYIGELRELQERIMMIKDRSHLQKIVNVIEETGLYQVTSTTFDFDLCTLDRVTVKKLQTCLALATT